MIFYPVLFQSHLGSYISDQYEYFFLAVNLNRFLLHDNVAWFQLLRPKLNFVLVRFDFKLLERLRKRQYALSKLSLINRHAAFRGHLHFSPLILQLVHAPIPQNLILTLQQFSLVRDLRKPGPKKTIRLLVTVRQLVRLQHEHSVRQVV